METKKLKKLSLSKKTVSSLDANRTYAGSGTITQFWTPNACGTSQTGSTCASNNATSCPTGCATC